MECINLKETNAHLIQTGRELEQAIKETQDRFFFHELEDGRKYYNWKNV